MTLTIELSFLPRVQKGEDGQTRLPLPPPAFPPGPPLPRPPPAPLEPPSSRPRPMPLA